jgi:hypothetical protein
MAWVHFQNAASDFIGPSFGKIAPPEWFYLSGAQPCGEGHGDVGHRDALATEVRTNII